MTLTFRHRPVIRIRLPGVVLGFPFHGQSDDPSISLERAA